MLVGHINTLSSADRSRQVEVRNNRLGPEDHPRIEQAHVDPTELRTHKGHVVRQVHGGALDRAIGFLADSFERTFVRLVRAEPLDGEQDIVRNAVDSDNSSRHLEILGSPAEVVVGRIGRTGTASEHNHSGGKRNDDRLQIHNESFPR